MKLDERGKLVAKICGFSPSALEKWEPKLRAGGRKSNEIMVYGPVVSGLEEATGRALFSGVEDVDVRALCVSAPTFRKELDAIDGDVVVRINSPGGSVFQGSSIHGAMIDRRNKGDKVEVVVDGVAASIASMIMLGGSHISMYEMSEVMIHRASISTEGNAIHMRNIADRLEKADMAAAKVYAKAMDVKQSEAISMMGKETWFAADEAVIAGLGDRVIVPTGSKKADRGIVNESRDLEICKQRLDADMLMIRLANREGES